MAYQQVPLELVRDGQGTPWGFRLTGGADIGSPLVVQKVREDFLSVIGSVISVLESIDSLYF